MIFVMFSLKNFKENNFLSNNVCISVKNWDMSV